MDSLEIYKRNGSFYKFTISDKIGYSEYSFPGTIGSSVFETEKVIQISIIRPDGHHQLVFDRQKDTNLAINFIDEK